MKTTTTSASQLRLVLYTLGRSLRSDTAEDNLRRMLDAHCPDGYALEIVDVLEHPLEAERDNVVATPTLVRRSPLPVRHIMGDLSAADQVLDALGVDVPGVARKNT